jgi:hypothetical protein
MGTHRLARATLLAVALVLGGCGTYVPELQEFYESRDAAHIRVGNIVAYLQCEVITSVQAAMLQDEDLAPVRRAAHLQPDKVLPWLKDWAAQITLILTVDEKSALAPSVSFNTIFPNSVKTFSTGGSVTTPQNFSLGLAPAFSADATRKETLAWYVDFKQFTDEKHLAFARRTITLSGQPPCTDVDGLLFDSDIKFKDWLFDATLPLSVARGPGADFAAALKREEGVSKKDVISHDVTFVVLYGGSITPTWKLVSISANGGSSPFLNAQRTNTQEAIITLGPRQGPALSVAAQNTVLAAQIGTAVANAIRNTQ